MDRLAGEEGVARSKIVAEALRIYLSRYKVEKLERYPTVLWKLKVSGALRLRSPRRAAGRVTGGMRGL